MLNLFIQGSYKAECLLTSRKNMKTNSQFFDELSDDYDLMINFENALKKKISFIKNFLAINYKTALDLGCDTGADAIALSKLGIQVDAVDHSSGMLQKAIKNGKKFDTNINFIEKLSLVQEYQLIQDSIWFLAKDKFIANFNLTGAKNLSLIGKKTTTYNKILINQASLPNSIVSEVKDDKRKELVIVSNDALEKPDSFWQSNRHEALNKNEINFTKWQIAY